MPRWLSDLWYDVGFTTSYIGLLAGWSMREEGGHHFPKRGPALLIANHQSFFDPLIIGVAARRRLVYLARKTLFANRGFGALLRSWGVVPIDQEGVGKEGLRTILFQLEKGRAVAVFPEGERTGDGTMQRPKPGIVLLIKRVQAPIVPMGIAGAFAAWPRHQRVPNPAPLFLPRRPGTIAVSVGQPLDGRRLAELPREQVLDELYRELQKVQMRAERLRRKE